MQSSQQILSKAMADQSYTEVKAHIQNHPVKLADIRNVLATIPENDLLDFKQEAAHVLAHELRYKQATNLRTKTDEKPSETELNQCLEHATQVAAQTRTPAPITPAGEARTPVNIEIKKCIDAGNVDGLRNIIKANADTKLNDPSVIGPLPGMLFNPYYISSTWLTYASALGKTEIVRYLVEEAKVEVDAASSVSSNKPLANQYNCGLKALHCAANPEIATLLVQHGAPIDSPNEAKMTPTDFALHKRDAVMTQHFVNAGADPALATSTTSHNNEAALGRTALLNNSIFNRQKTVKQTITELNPEFRNNADDIISQYEIGEREFIPTQPEPESNNYYFYEPTG